METIDIDLDYYNSEEKEKFRNNYPELFNIIQNNIGTIQIPLEDFKAYFLFKHQAIQNPKLFPNFLAEVIRKWPYFEDYYTYNTEARLFKSFESGTNGNTEISEALGIAGALSISSKLFLGTTQADWRKIPQMTTKNFDFSSMAVVDGKYLTVEAKGSVVSSNINPSEVSYHKSSILGKKRDPNFVSQYNNSTDYCYGVITVADPNNMLKAWLVDPPVVPQNITPLKYRLLSRLYFYNDYLRIISGRSYLSLLLPNRIEDIANVTDYTALNKMPLIGAGYNKIQLRKSFVETRSRMTFEQKSVIGYTGTMQKGNIILFIGLEEELLRILINQNFDQLMKYYRNPNTVESLVVCKISKSNSNNILIKVLEERKYKAEKGFYFFRCNMHVHCSSAGIFFGSASINNILINE